jgi:hypothetical protein
MSDITLQLLASPGRGLSRALERQPVGLGLFILVAAQASASIALVLASQGPGTVVPFLDVPVSCCKTVLVLCVVTAFVHLFATLLGGRGDPAELFWTLVVGDAPWLFATPAVLVAIGLDAGVPGSLGLWLFLAGTVLVVWSVGLKSYGVAFVYGVSGARALFCFFVAYGAILTLLVALGCVSVMEFFVTLALVASRS